MRGDDIEGTNWHSAGAYAKCFACGRFSDNPKFLVGQEVVCDCGRKNMWVFKFAPPNGLSRWSENSQEVQKELDKLTNLLESIDNPNAKSIVVIDSLSAMVQETKECNLMTADIETTRKILRLIMNESIFLSDYNREKDIHDDGIYPVINCNDLFCPGSDAEPLYFKDVDLYTEVVKRWPNDIGCLAWCAVQRGSEPWKNFDNIEVAKACAEAAEFIKEMIKERDKNEQQ